MNGVTNGMAVDNPLKMGILGSGRKKNVYSRVGWLMLAV